MKNKTGVSEFNNAKGSRAINILLIENILKKKAPIYTGTLDIAFKKPELKKTIFPN